MLGVGPASAAATPGAQPSFVSGSPMLSFVNGTAETTVQVLNPGAVTSARFAVVLAPSCTTLSDDQTVGLVADGITTVTLQGPAAFSTALTGATVVMAPGPAPSAGSAGCQIAPLTATGQPVVSQASVPAPTWAAVELPVSLQHNASVWVLFVLPLVVGILLAGLVCSQVAPKVSTPEFIRAASSWNFKDSLATNVTALGGLLATVLSAAGGTSKVFPGVDLSRFSLVNAGWTGLALTAPLILGLRKAVADPTGGPGAADIVEPHAGSDPPPVLAATGAVVHAVGAFIHSAAMTSGASSDTVATAADVSTAADAFSQAVSAPPPVPPGVSVSRTLLRGALFVTMTAVGAELTTIGAVVWYAAASTPVRLGVDAVMLLIGVLISVYVTVGTNSLIETQKATSGPSSATNAYHSTALAA